MNEDNRQRRSAQSRSVRLGAGIEFDFRPVRVAPANYSSEHDSMLADLSILDAGRNAEAEGYSAVCIDTMSDSGLNALRSVVSIPVIGPGRASMLMATLLGERFSIVIMWDRWRYLYRKSVAELGFQQRCASVRSIDVQPDHQALLAGKEEQVFPLLLDAAMKCIQEDGAHVILLGSTTMHEAHAYLADRLPVPVINPGPLTYKLAETALGLGLSHSAKAYPPPHGPVLSTLDAMIAAAQAQQSEG